MIDCWTSFKNGLRPRPLAGEASSNPLPEQLGHRTSSSEPWASLFPPVVILTYGDRPVDIARAQQPKLDRITKSPETEDNHAQEKRRVDAARRAQAIGGGAAGSALVHSRGGARP